MPRKEIEFINEVSIVPASWWNLIQEHLAGFANLRLTYKDANEVRVSSGDSNEVSGIYIGGEMRRRDTLIDLTISGGAGTYEVYATADSADNLFALESVLLGNTPVATKTRKIGEVDWNGSAITAVRQTVGRVEVHAHELGLKIDHSAVTGATDDDHTQYSLVSGSRAFTNPVAGVTPTASAHLSTKDYAEGRLAPFPAGALVFWGPDPIPPGYLLCDGTAKSRATFASLFGAIGTLYGGGDGSTTFNLPNFRGRMPVGKTAAGTASTLGATGGSLEHTHTQPAHTHTMPSHSHGLTAHSHDGATSDAAAGHAHSQGVTGDAGAHAHTNPNHGHFNSGLTTGDFGDAVWGGRAASAWTPGLFQFFDLNEGSSSTSHSHGRGTYNMPEAFGDSNIYGTSSSASMSHTHDPAGFAYEHEHGPAGISGETTFTTGGNTSTSANHDHTNPTTATSLTHTHTVGTTGTGLTTTDSGGAIASGSGGADVTGPATFPYFAVQVLIKT